jgi:hypothetical protein
MRNLNERKMFFETMNTYKFRCKMGKGKWRNIAICAQEKTMVSCNLSELVQITTVAMVLPFAHTL